PIIVGVVDRFGNPCNTNAIVTASRNAGSGTLQGVLAVGCVNGIATYTNLSHNVATTITIDFTAAGLLPLTSDPVVVSPAAFAQLQVLAPGETAAPGTSSGKTGTPNAQTAGMAFNVTVNAVDANWNLVTNVADTVGFTSSDVNAALPANAVLSLGSKVLSLTLKTAGSATVTASDITDGTKTPNTSPAVAVNAGAVTKLQILLPGETAAPGTGTGKTGSPT